MVEYSVKFNWVDYLVFALSLVVTVFVGVGLAIKQKWLQQTSEDYLMASRKMNWVLVALSFWASVMTARLLVLFTSEYYYSGMPMIWVNVSLVIAAIFTAIFMIPKFYRLGFTITSAYEYFEHRFNLPVRMVVVIMYFLISMLYLAVSLYIPCVVLSQVSVISIHWCVFMGSIVCIIYTGFGGMKAVIWVDSIQILVVAAGMLALVIKGTSDAGGIHNVWKIYSEIGKRDNWDDTNTDPWERSSILVNVLMWSFFMMAYYGAEQTQIQRYISVPNLRLSQRAVLFGTLMGMFFMTLTMFMGMVGFALVGGNEALLNKKISAQDQILPYFLMYGLGQYHGIPGLVVAAVFASALSTLSSGQTAMAAVFLEDVIKPIHKMRTGKPLSQRWSGIASKVLGVLVGLGTMAIGMAIPEIGATLINIAFSMQAFIIGPLFGLMLAGLFMVWVESWGAMLGLLAGVGWTVMLWSGGRAYGHGLGRDRKPLFTHNFTVQHNFEDPDVEGNIFDVAFMWYTMLAVGVVLIVSTIVSLSVHAIRKCRNRKYSMKATFPAKEFRYTMDDFLVAIAYRTNTVPYNKPEEAIKEKNEEELDNCSPNHTESNLGYNYIPQYNIRL